MELNILNEVAALQRLIIGQLRERLAQVFGEATPASMRVWRVKGIASFTPNLAELDILTRCWATPPTLVQRRVPRSVSD